MSGKGYILDTSIRHVPRDLLLRWQRSNMATQTAKNKVNF